MTFSGFDAVFFTVSFLVPGFVCSAVLSMLVPRRAVETQIRFLEFLTLSCINHGVWSWALFLIFKTGLVDREPAWTGLALLGIMFVSPIALGLVSAWLQQTAFVARFLNWFGFRTVHPTPSAWDYYFSQARPCWALVTLKDGSRVYGLYGFRSFAGSDPKDRDLYLEATYRLVETGDWAPVEDTAGILISADQIAAIEFRTLTEVDSMSKGRQTRRTPLQEGYQPKPGNTEQRGYQPQAGGNVKPQNIKPPKGDTAIQPPKPPAGDKK